MMRNLNHIFGGILIIVLLFLFSVQSGAENHIVAPLATEYSWYYNGDLIPGEKYQILNVSKAGTYTVKMLNSDGSERIESYNLSATGTIRKLIFIGDSTASIYDITRYPRTGWAQVFQNFFNSSNVQVVDKAHSGRSTTTFYCQTDWFSIVPTINMGDFVFIQFGHNDNPGVPLDTFKLYLKKYVDETRAKGGIPVLCTPINRNSWNTSDTTLLKDTHGSYPLYMRNLAAEANVPLIDLTAKTIPFYQSLGKTKCSWNVFLYAKAGQFPYTDWAAGSSDNTHIQLWGATEICKLAVQGLRELSANSEIALLIPSLQNALLVDAEPNIPIAGIVAGNGSFAIGQTVTLSATIKNTSYSFANWTINGQIVSSSPTYTFTMGSSEIRLAANFKLNTALNTPNDKVLTVFPNPANDLIRITGDDNILSYNITDFAGKQLLHADSDNPVISVWNLKNGIYLLKVNTTDKAHIIKLFVKH